ncbi:MAG TPA: DoxX family protein [Polyangiaceae bacterium]|nr:DoxX family protein [Polyangiaceae bacterium]
MGSATSGWHGNERVWHFALWSAQLLLAGFFAAMALMKLLTAPEQLIETAAWADRVPAWLVYMLGGLELIGALLVAAPAVTPTPQRIVGVTALAFMALMVAAAIVHVGRGDLRMLPINFGVAALAAFVAWGRLLHRPLEIDGRY